jgi:hypothetical protein
MKMNNRSTTIEWHRLHKYYSLAEDFRLIMLIPHFQGHWPESRGTFTHEATLHVHWVKDKHTGIF